MAKTKTGGRTAQKPRRPGKRLGVKIFGGQSIKTGQIILRQRGASFHPGTGAAMGRDFTIFALKEGTVNFKKKQGKQVVLVS